MRPPAARLLPAIILSMAATSLPCEAQTVRAPSQPASARAPAGRTVPAAPDLAAGEATFKAICSVCHTPLPPPKLAPPMVMIGRHYREAFATEAEGRAALVRFISAPDTGRMTLPRHAYDRFGAMPRLALSEKQVRDVAAYVWSLGAPADSGRAR